jgi:UDP-N-acetylmuramoylalanine--D-glutamate ligase
MVAGSQEGQWNVLELSSFQLETIDAFRARIGVCTNVTPDHLDRHHTFENYANAKARLFETQGEDGDAILNADDPTCVGYASRTKANVLWFSRKTNSDVRFKGSTIFLGTEALLDATDLPIRGLHNVENAMAAAAAASMAGATLSGISAALKTFPGVEHRLEFVRNATVSTITMIRKPPTWMPPRRRSMLFREISGSFLAARIRIVITRCFERNFAKRQKAFS